MTDQVLRNVPVVLPTNAPGRRRRGLFPHYQWATWLYWVCMVVAGFGMLQAVRQDLLLTPEGLGIGILLAAVVTLLLTAVVRRLDLFEDEPGGMLVAAYAWGFVVAPTLVVVANDHLVSVFERTGLASWAAAVVGPTDEELIKLLGVVLVLYAGRAHVTRPLNGLVYGAMVGLGFEVSENISYIVQGALMDPSSDAVGALQVGLSRVLIGLGGHAMFSAIAGFGIAYALVAFHVSTVRRVTTAVAAYALAWVLHFAWNAPEIFFPSSEAGAFGSVVLKYVVLVLAFVLVFRYARHIDHRWFEAALADQPDDVVTPGETEALRSVHGRRAARKAARRAGGRAESRRLADLQEAQLRLATLLGLYPDGSPPVEVQKEVVREIRARLTAPA
ncbi:PrsW family intramembrane metalloprotease [Oerskovia sp. NPDC057915]|uniref:PrsW family intramembrane metalloprotease n=1 Tax=Oerskovia sp. NPDC057915 TaxID=3346280 RepID=UPI0036DA94D2